MGESVVSVMRRGVPLLLVVSLGVALLGPASAEPGKKGKAQVHKPPYKKGNQGGDSWNYVHADPKSGEVAVFRLFPGFSPVVGCAPEPDAGWATLTQPHRVTKPVRNITVNFEGALEPYAWATAVVWDTRGESLGLAKFQGPHMGAGRMKIKLFRRPATGSTITIEFGAQLGDSCPQLSAAAISFPSIKVH